MYKSTGFISFVLRRFTGVVLVLYLFTHILVISSVNFGADAFDAAMRILQSPLFRVAEVGLLAALAYHAFDGVRLIIGHYFKVTDQRKNTFFAAFAVAALVTVAGGIPILLHALESITR